LPRNKHIDWGAWQEIIKELTKEAAKIGEKASAGAAKDNALSFYSGAISDLNAFKDEYRNQVMHVRKEYDEHQALRALVKVREFMERVSEKMNHKHQRIRWGLKFR
jgi:protein-disulfide isomerase-like protein with CxxC motif